MDQKHELVMTMTGEVFQPVRLFYRVHDMDRLQRRFGRMSCMNFDDTNDRWTWLYAGEARKLKFAQPYKAIPKHVHPIILGSFYSGGDDEMRLDIGSIERATKAVVFFDRRIDRSIAEVSYVAIYNKLPSNGTDHPGYNFDALFADVRTEEIDARMEAEIERLTEAVKSGRFTEFMKEPRFELVEAFPVNFHEEGINQLRDSLRMRQAVAFQRWSGNTNFTMTDVIDMMVGQEDFPVGK